MGEKRLGPRSGAGFEAPHEVTQPDPLRPAAPVLPPSRERERERTPIPRGPVEGADSEAGPTPPPVVRRSPLPPQMRVGAAVVAGRYRILTPIGAGSMGKIFLAEQVSVGRRVALKILNRELTAKYDTIARFQQEARLLASVPSEHVVDIYDIGETESGDPFIAMEYVNGPSLHQIIRDQAPLAPERVLRILVQLASALAMVHAAGVVHRDLKPANLVIVTRKDGFEIVKILDFGLAKVVHDREATGRLTRHGVILGTPEYMAPEQVSGTDVDHRADLYAVGCTAYEMIAGAPPFVGQEMSILYKHLHEPPRPIAEAAPAAQVPAPLAEVIMRCLAKQPKERYQSARDLHRALLAAADAMNVPRRALRIPRSSLEDPPDHTAGDAQAPRPRARRLETALLAAVMLVVGLAGGVLVQRERAPAVASPAPAPAAAPATSTLIVVSEPPAAQLTIDGQPGPLTPAAVELAPGAHTVRVDKRGWRALEQRVEVAAGAAPRLELVLERPRYAVAVTSDPPGARLTIDGKDHGTTPTSVELSEGEFHEVELRRDGFVTKTVFMPPDLRQEELRVALDPVRLQTGFLLVDSPESARVIVDGRDTGEWTPTSELSLAPGVHQIELVDAVGMRRRASARVEVGQVTTVVVPPVAER